MFRPGMTDEELRAMVEWSHTLTPIMYSRFWVGVDLLRRQKFLEAAEKAGSYEALTPALKRIFDRAKAQES